MNKWNRLREMLEEKLPEPSPGYDWAVRRIAYREILDYMKKIEDEESCKSLTEAGY